MALALLSLNNTRARLATCVVVDANAAPGFPVIQPLLHREIAEFTPETLELALAGSPGLERIILSSVHPPTERRLEPLLAHWPVLRVGHKLHLGFSLDEYAGRATLGGDRIAGLAAAGAWFPLPSIVLDLGTAVTVNVLDAGRVYRGGYIAPGLRLHREYLRERTAQLPALDPEELMSVAPGLGQDTRSAMAAGIRHAFQGQLQGLLSAALVSLGEIGETPQSIIVTGGDAALLTPELAAPLTAAPVITEPGLALMGMVRLAQLNPL